jgi:hypothetical protein
MQAGLWLSSAYCRGTGRSPANVDPMELYAQRETPEPAELLKDLNVDEGGLPLEPFLESEPK